MPSRLGSEQLRDESVLKEPRELTFAAVQMSSDVKYLVALSLGTQMKAYIDSKHMVYVGELRTVSTNGPFIEFDLTCESGGQPLVGAEIEVVRRDGSTDRAKADERGAARLTLTKAQQGAVRLRTSHPRLSATRGIRIATPIVSAQRGAVVYFDVPCG